MNFHRPILSSFLLGSSLAGHAQAIEPAPIPRFYGGLGVYSSSHHNLSSWGNGARIPVQAVVGYQWRPRLAVQLGVAYSGNRSTYDSRTDYYSVGTPTAYRIGTYSERNATTTLLARYTLTRKLQHRFQADVLGGIKFEYSRYRDVGSTTTYQAAPDTTPYSYFSTYTNTLLSLGPSLRYRVVSRLDIVYDLTFDLPLGGSFSNSYYGADRRSQATMALGLRYRFGPS